MSKMRKLTMEDLQSGTLEGITMEDVHCNSFMVEIEFTPPKPGQIKIACAGDSITYGYGIYNWFGTPKGTRCRFAFGKP